MKKSLFFWILSIFVFLLIASPARAACPCQSSSPTMGVFSDPGFSQSTHNFSSGQMVYVRVETSGAGERKNELRVLDAGKKAIKTMSLARSGSGPYTYTASFSTPEVPGIYYLDIKIEGEGSSFARQENINVDGGDGGTSASSVAKSVVDQAGQAQPTFTPKTSPTVREATPAVASSPEESPISPTGFQALCLTIIEFLRRIFSYLTPHNLTLRL